MTNHGTYGTTDFATTYTVCTRWIFGVIQNRTQDLQLDGRSKATWLVIAISLLETLNKIFQLIITDMSFCRNNILSFTYHLHNAQSKVTTCPHSQNKTYILNLCSETLMQSFCGHSCDILIFVAILSIKMFESGYQPIKRKI